MFCVGNLPVITAPIIETAENRVHLLRATRNNASFFSTLESHSHAHYVLDAFLEFGHHPGVGGPLQVQLNQITNQLQQIQNDIVNSFARIDARLANSHISSDNRHHFPNPLRPLQKTVCLFFLLSIYSIPSCSCFNSPRSLVMAMPWRLLYVGRQFCQWRH